MIKYIINETNDFPVQIMSNLLFFYETCPIILNQRDTTVNISLLLVDYNIMLPSPFTMEEFRVDIFYMKPNKCSRPSFKQHQLISWAFLLYLPPCVMRKDYQVKKIKASIGSHAWDKLFMHKIDWGMNIKNLSRFNLAMVGKHGWHIMSNPNWWSLGFTNLDSIIFHSVSW